MSRLNPVASYTWVGVAAVVLIASMTAFFTGYYDLALPKWFSVIAVAVIALAYCGAQSWKTAQLTFDRYDLAIFCLLGFAGLSLLWSADPLTGTMFLAKFGLFALIFRCVKDCATLRMLRGICWAITLSAAVVLGMAWQIPLSYGGFYNPNYVTEYLLVTLPFIAAAGFEGKWPARATSGALAAVLLAYLFGFNPSKIEFLVLPAGFALLLLFVPYRSWLKWVAVSACAVAGAAALYWGWDSLAASKGFKESVGVRLWLDIDTLLMWLDSPIWGQGAGSFEAMFPLYKERGLTYIADPVILATITGTMLVPEAAHNDVLQLLGDLGVIGALPVGLFLYWLLRAHAKQGRHSPLAWAGVGGVAMTLPNMLINFPLQNPATAMLAALACGMAANQLRRTDSGFSLPLNKAGRILVVMGIAATAVACSVGGYRWHHASLLMRQASKVYQKGNSELNFRLTREAYAWFPLDRTIRTRVAYSLSAWIDNSGDAEPLPSEEIDQVFRIGMNGGQYDSGLLVARVLYLLNSGRYAENMEETERLLGLLKQSSSQLADTHHLEALLGVLTQDYPRARAAIARGRDVPELSVEQSVELDRLEATLGGGAAAVP